VVGVSQGVITFTDLTKRFGPLTAVDRLSVSVSPGRVTGFLGPNGAGKTTSLRCLLGLVQPSSGSAVLDGVRYEDLPDPTRAVGASLEATGFHPGRRARDHLRFICDAAGLPAARADEVLVQVGLAEASDRRVGQFSLGMRQRLALAAALVGDPQFLILDEPANGLDPQGIAWLRGFLRYLADHGRTVLISSHVLSEIQQTADDVIIISHGKLVAASSLAELERARGAGSVLATSPSADVLVHALAAQAPGAQVDQQGSDVVIRGLTAPQVGAIAFGAGVELHGLTERAADLERLFLDLTAQAEEPGAAA